MSWGGRRRHNRKRLEPDVIGSMQRTLERLNSEGRSQLMRVSNMEAEVSLAKSYVLFVWLDRECLASMQKYTATGHDVMAILGRGYVLV